MWWWCGARSWCGSVRSLSLSCSYVSSVHVVSSPLASPLISAVLSPEWLGLLPSWCSGAVLVWLTFALAGSVTRTTTVTELRQAVGLWCGSSAIQQNAEATYGPITEWDTSLITSMREVFSNQANCNPDVSAWNTSRVTTMRSMFRDAASFNGDISPWDTSRVTSMSHMFYQADSFNKDLSP